MAKERFKNLHKKLKNQSNMTEPIFKAIKVKKDGRIAYRMVATVEDKLFYGIIKNPTPRNERNYPVRTNKRF